ncbi:MAG: hypothetical protein IJT54_03940 [Candidatus Methanomethylophilaceae archaeon]|nr:hypothetical protein [Candidatus Methanomethylophilaceae archaeon]
MSIIRLRPQTKGMKDDHIIGILHMASSFYEEYTRTEDTGADLDALIVDIATIDINMAGAEGTSSANEGGISRTWSRLPDDVRSRLNARRRMIGV